MSTTIQMLEKLGRNPVGSPVMARVGKDESSKLNPAEYRARLDRDVETLRKLSNGREAMRCLIATPE